ncbi:tyrosine-type recombinase/integrase [Rhodococcus opacus]|nr:tyrosine-type recombinase/integrase [Rhodococcus opacus]
MREPEDAVVEVLPAVPKSRNDKLVLAFLARYKSGTRESYDLDLRLFFEWCYSFGMDPIGVQRVHIELFARYLETHRGNAPSTVARRLTCLRSFFWILEEDGEIPVSPARNLKRPKWSPDITQTGGLDRDEFRELMKAARSSNPSDEALIALLGMLGLRVSEACSLDVDSFSETRRGHRVVQFMGKGDKAAAVPLPVPVLRAMENAAGTRESGPLILRADGSRMSRRSADRVVKRLAKQAGILKRVSPHVLRHTFVTAAFDAKVPLRDVQIAARHADVRQTLAYDRARQSLDSHATYAVAAFLGSSDDED